MTTTTKSKIVTLFVILLVAGGLAPSGAVQDERADEVFSFANQLMRDRLFEAAAQQFLKFATGNPRDPRAPEALEKAAMCLSRSDSDDEAIKVLETLIDTYAASADLCAPKVRLGRLYYNKKRYTDADRVYSDVIALMPDCPLYPDALLGKGEALIPLEKYNAAVDLFSVIVTRHLDSKIAPRAFFDLAFCQQRLGRDSEALETYSAMVRTFPKDPLSAFASIEAAEMRVSARDSLAAVDHYSAARKFREKAIFVPATLKGAVILEQIGDHERALAWYRELLDLDNFGDTDTDPATVYGAAARAAYYAGDYESVFDFSKQYTQRFEGSFSPEITYYKALAELRRADFTRALEDAGTLDARAAGSKWALEAARVRGEALIGAQRPREAISELRRFVSSTPDSSAKCDALEMIADALMTSLGDTASALDAMQEKLEVEKNRHPLYMLRTGRAFESARRYREAGRLYEEIVDGFPLSKEAEAAERRLTFLREFTLLDPQTALALFADVAYEITSMEDNAARLKLAETRLNIAKDPNGALEILSKIKSSLRSSSLRPKALYVEGACHASLARKASLLGQNEQAGTALEMALDCWGELTGQHAASEWSAKAAADRVLLSAEVSGEVDTAAVFQTLSRYPKLADRSSLLELLGDYYSQKGTKSDAKRALAYYQQALTLSGEDDSAELELKVAEALSAEGRDTDAWEIFGKLVTHDRKRIRIQAAYGAGKTLRSLRRYEEALSHFRNVGGEAGGHFKAKALLQAADCQYLMKQYNEALLAYRQVETIATDPGLRWELTFRIGLCQRRLGRLREALQAMENCIDAQRGGQLRSRAFMQGVQIARELGDSKTERRLLSLFIKEFREGDAALAASRQLVRLHLRVNEPSAGLALARDLVQGRDKPEDEDVALYIMALYRGGEVQDAKSRRTALAKKLGASAPLLREIAVEEAKYYYGEKDFVNAATAVAGLTQSCPGDSVCEEGLYLYSVSLIAQDKVEEGTRQAQRFFERYPLSNLVPPLHLKLGNMLSTKFKRHNEALTHYREAANAAKDSAVVFNALKHLAIAFQTLSRWGEAGKAWAEVIERFPNSSYAPEASLNAARCKMESGDYVGAIGAYERALPLLDGEDRARAYYWTGICHQTLGDFQAAIVEYLKVPYLLPSQAMWAVTAQLKAAECYTSVGRYQAAREIYTSVIERFGASSNWGKVAQKALADLESAKPEGEKGGGEG
ncbi:MAG: tetratricopeptide repeat protein [Candidatus Latescibacteria bacterium]|nr:tetratricopeptide repeat protein [Candidatus Latescibacterota bacterium]NIO27317.1 tetratricopeptide repeat protein [Candidatus Latescibacterota bacterium]NIO54841.1 tetratricopeptide repeat protein [Candidatus Latescibacterota bacterium]NIT00924.1 tetratricopeptide repeat protein [Candidatus Latescibacterota bacterium]NIT37847.1 tetratricopeptide repeat protein [Candidatus Latescibacterota bacterium]